MGRPRLDLTGRRFGRLTVLRRAGRMKFGRMQFAWLCQCDCGARLRVPQIRLPHYASIPSTIVIDACRRCRVRPCVVCGGPVRIRKSMSKTCSPKCGRTLRRARMRAVYHRNAPAILAQQKARLAAMSAEERRAHNEVLNSRARKYQARKRKEIRADPARHAEYLAEQRDKRRKRAEREGLRAAAAEHGVSVPTLIVATLRAAGTLSRRGR